MLFLTLTLSPSISESRNNLVEESRPAVKKVGEVKEIGIGVYWEKNCVEPVSYIDWGGIAPRSSKDITVFMRNEGNTPITLSIYTSNWNPSETADFVDLTWNHTGETIEPQQVLPVTLSLHVDVDIKGISAFSFDAIIGATGSLMTGIVIRMAAFVTYPEWILDINPDTVNLKSRGRWITCYIELSEGFSVTAIDPTTVMLNDTIPVDSFWLDKPLESVIGDYDNDTIPDSMVKFDKQALIEYLKNKGITDAEATLAITGEANGLSFEATDTIKVVGQ